MISVHLPDLPSCTRDKTLIDSCTYENKNSSHFKRECAPRSFGDEDDYCHRKGNNDANQEVVTGLDTISYHRMRPEQIVFVIN